MKRSSGILLHVTSLPGAHGIGDLGPAAYAWIDKLAGCGQTWWQMLPLGPTGYADSPYQCLSAFAGNPNLISLELLVGDGFLEPKDLPRAEWPRDEVDFDRVTPYKLAATQRAYERFKSNSSGHEDYARFCKDEAKWLADFALYTALKERHGGAAWWDWPAEARDYERAWATKSIDHLPAMELCTFRQYCFFRQWQQLREYAHRRGVRLIGDMPIFISSDSADVWSQPELFLLDDDRQPTFVAGVPPDYFSKTGQLWGNPLYDWAKHRATGYAWWIDRMQSSLWMVDLVRLDHFRGFESYWAVPAGSQTAQPGSWVAGPGADFIGALQASLGSLPLIVEDLGVITPEVDALRTGFDLPGMRILQFAFGGAQEDRFFPHHYERQTVVYTGTHDNETTVGWYGNLSHREQEFLDSYAPGAGKDPAWGLMRLAWGSVADLAIAPLQDLLRLGNEARMNLPGTAEGNWRWRLDPRLLKGEIFERLGEMTTIYQRRERKSEEEPEI